MDSTEKTKTRIFRKFSLPETSIKKKDLDMTRRPLKTILDQASNLPNANVIECQKEQKCRKLTKTDTRFVTIRSKKEELDWNYDVFKDEENAPNDVGDDDEIATKSDRKTVHVLHNKILDQCPTETKTPVLAARGEHSRLKNIKKSLKRPHSRELQGLASAPDDLMGLEEDRIKKRFKDSSDVKSPDVCKISNEATQNRVYGLDMFSYLLEKEEKWPIPIYLGKIKKRACSLNWLIDINGSADPAIIHTAAWYLDSIYTMRKITMDDIPVAVSACFWISRKVHGPVKSVHTLVQCSCKAFDSSALCKAEKKILQLLKFPQQPVLPQEFITYLAWWCNNDNPEEIQMAASFICMSALILNLEMCGQYPSAIAAAAIRTALLLLKKQHLMEKLKGCFVYQAALVKADFIEVCISQIEALKMLYTEGFEFIAPKNLCRNRFKTIPDIMKSELEYLYLTGGEGIIRAFLM